MFAGLKKHWHDLASGKPGHRFESHYRRSHRSASHFHRICKLCAAFLLILVGIVLLFIPGPGSVLIVIGAALLAQESEGTARALDSLEMKLRRLISRARQLAR